MGCTPPEKHQEGIVKGNNGSNKTLTLNSKTTTSLQTSKKVDKHEIGPRRRIESFLPLESNPAY